MKYPFNVEKKELKNYLFELKEVCIIEHEDNWFKEKSHTKLYPNVNEAKLKVAKPHYWIINAVEKYEVLSASDHANMASNRLQYFNVEMELKENTHEQSK